jgi:hypothetical protein
VELLRIARDRTPQHHLPECEVWGRAFAVEDGGTLRCVRVLLLHCMRQQASRPLRYKVKRQGGKVTKELDLVVSGAEHELNERGEWEIVPGGETVRVVWPKTPRDFSTEMCEAKVRLALTPTPTLTLTPTRTLTLALALTLSLTLTPTLTPTLTLTLTLTLAPLHQRHGPVLAPLDLGDHQE